MTAGRCAITGRTPMREGAPPFVVFGPADLAPGAAETEWHPTPGAAWAAWREERLQWAAQKEADAAALRALVERSRTWG